MKFFTKISITLLRVIFVQFIFISCSQYHRVTCPAYNSNFYVPNGRHDQQKSVRLQKAVNSAYKSFYKNKCDIKRNKNTKNESLKRSGNTAGTKVNGYVMLISPPPDFYASNSNSISLKKSQFPIIEVPLSDFSWKSSLNKKIFRDEFKRDLKLGNSGIKYDAKYQEIDPDVKLAMQSSKFGIYSLICVLLSIVPIIQIITLPAAILLSVFAIEKGRTALRTLDKTNLKSISKARKGIRLGKISLWLLGVEIFLYALFLIFFMFLAVHSLR